MAIPPLPLTTIVRGPHKLYGLPIVSSRATCIDTNDKSFVFREANYRLACKQTPCQKLYNWRSLSVAQKSPPGAAPSKACGAFCLAILLLYAITLSAMMPLSNTRAKRTERTIAAALEAFDLPLAAQHHSSATKKFSRDEQRK